MLALLALATLAPLLIVPGALIARALLGAVPGEWSLEGLYARVALGALLNGWLAFTLGQLGVFSPWLHLTLVLAICALAAFGAYRRGSLLPLWKAAGPHLGLQWRSLPLPTLALSGALLIFALLIARPFEVVIGVRDAGVYANAGFAMARTGSLVQRDDIVAQIAADKRSADPELAAAAAQAETNFLGVQPRQRNIATRLRAAGFYINEGELDDGLVTPQGLHLFSAWVGLLTSLLGAQGGLLAPGLMGLLGVWSIGMLGRRLAGPWAGALAALLLALNATQVWFSRYSTTETTAQFLTFAGLYFFACATASSERLRAKDQGPPINEETDLRPSSFSGLLAGLAFGQLALARIDFFLVLGPLAIYLLYTWLTRRWFHAHTLLLAGLAVMLAHAAVQFTTLARAYFFDTLFARLQDYAVTALVALPFLTPALRQTFLTRPCSPLTLQPCPPVAGMEPTTDAPWNIARIATELVILALLVLALLALRRWGQPLLARAEKLVRRLARPLTGIAVTATLLVGAYAYLVRPQILTAETLAALPSCLAPAQLRSPGGACLALQGYIGAPITAPAYVNPLAAWLGSLPQRLRGQNSPTPETCAALRDELLPPAAKGRTVPELIRDKLLDESTVGEEAMAQLRTCDRLVLRSQFANSQANLVRVGWYLSPLGIALGLLGLALLWRRLTPGSWLFLVVAIVASLVFVRLTYGTSDQHYIYILRRYVPQVYPALALAAAVALLSWANDQGPRTRGTGLLIEGGGRRPSVFGRLSSVWRLGSLGLGAALIAFLIVTGRPIFRHVEYGGALEQIGAVAARFEPGDVLLLRGGGPTHGESRDLPDVLATPLTFAFGVDALTIKSKDPAAYANDLARYIRHWQADGRTVYLALSASGGLPLPGLALEPAGQIGLSLREFEQLTNQKPQNVQDFEVGFALYRVVHEVSAQEPATAIGPSDYAAQLQGLYRAEISGGAHVAWTNGDALLRVELPKGARPEALALQLAGGKRPTAMGPAQACVSVRPENGSWAGDPQAPPFSQPECFTLGEGLTEYTLRLTVASLPTRGDTLLVRITSDTWIPARDDPQGRDPRRLGVQLGGLRLLP